VGCSGIDSSIVVGKGGRNIGHLAISLTLTAGLIGTTMCRGGACGRGMSFSNCPECGHGNGDGARFCEQCTAGFCSQRGIAVDDGVGPVADGSLKVASVVFSDLVGSTVRGAGEALTMGSTPGLSPVEQFKTPTEAQAEVDFAAEQFKRQPANTASKIVTFDVPGIHGARAG
jgi:hypothetical protein